MHQKPKVGVTKKQQDDFLTHINREGKIRMVDISDKNHNRRTARAECLVKISPPTLKILKKNNLITSKKGDALACAKTAAILAAKKTSEIIPLAHQINLSYIDVSFSLVKEGILVSSYVKTDYSTGVEMEALVATATAALTLYDMLKATERGIIITSLRLVEKTGGKSGNWLHPCQKLK